MLEVINGMGNECLGLRGIILMVCLNPKALSVFPEPPGPFNQTIPEQIHFCGCVHPVGSWTYIDWVCVYWYFAVFYYFDIFCIM